MADELSQLDSMPAPELTLTPDVSAETVPVAEAHIIPNAAENTPALEDSLTPEELAQVDAFAKQIDVSNTATVLQYGAGAQKKMADFSESALERVRTQDLGEAGDLIAGVVVELKSFDADEEKGLFGFFKKQANKVTALKARYDKAEANVNKIVGALENHQMALMKDAAMLDKLYELNLTYFK